MVRHPGQSRPAYKSHGHSQPRDGIHQEPRVGSATYSGLTFYGLIDTNPTVQPYGFNTVGVNGDRVGGVLPNGTGTVSITDVSTTLRQVTVTVTWRSVRKTRSVVISWELATLTEGSRLPGFRGSGLWYLTKRHSQELV